MSRPNAWLGLTQHPLVNAFINVPDFRYGLMHYITATDISMFLASFNLAISDTERRKFMNPIRDLGDEHEDIQRLISMGFKVALVGKDCRRLLERIAMPVTYCMRYGRREMLQIMAVGSAAGSTSASEQLLCEAACRRGDCMCSGAGYRNQFNILPLLSIRAVSRVLVRGGYLEMYRVWVTNRLGNCDHITLMIRCKACQEPDNYIMAEFGAKFVVEDESLDRYVRLSASVISGESLNSLTMDTITITNDPWTIRRIPGAVGGPGWGHVGGHTTFICHLNVIGTTKLSGEQVVFLVPNGFGVRDGLVMQPRIMNDYQAHSEDVAVQELSNWLTSLDLDEEELASLTGF